MSTTIPQKAYHVYLLIDPQTGVFYVGIGKLARLYTTLHEVYNRAKALRIRQIQERGDTVIQEIAYSSDNKSDCCKIEHFLIECYKPYLVNGTGITSKYPTSTYEHETIDTSNCTIYTKRARTPKKDYIPRHKPLAHNLP